jgi:hypothetical protein
MSAPGPVNWAIRDAKGLHPMVRLVLYTLASRGDDARPALSLIAENMGISRAAAKRWVHAAAATGWLKIEGRTTAAGDPDSNRYTVVPQLTASAGGGVAADPTGGVSTDPGVGSVATPKEVKGSRKAKERSLRGRASPSPLPTSGGETPVKRSREPAPNQRGLFPAAVPDPQADPEPGKVTAGTVTAAFCKARSPRTITPTDRSLVGRAAKELLAAGVDPDELCAAAAELGEGIHSNLRTQVQIRERSRQRQPGHSGHTEVSPLDSVQIVAPEGPWRMHA